MTNLPHFEKIPLYRISIILTANYTNCTGVGVGLVQHENDTLNRKRELNYEHRKTYMLDGKLTQTKCC